MITIYYSEEKQFTGTLTYSLNLYHDLQKAGEKVRLTNLRKIEIPIGGIRLGGTTSQSFFTKFAKHSEINHSMHGGIVNRYTNVVTVHDIIPYTQKEWFNIPERRKKQYARMMKMISKLKIIVESEYVKEDILFLLPEADISIIPMAVRIPDYPLQNPYPDDGKYHLVTMGEIKNGYPMNNRKQIPELYDFVANNPDIVLYHIGLINDERYLHYARNIIQLGQISEKAKLEYLKYADRYVFYTRSEGQGIPTMEAMRLDTQAIVNDLPVHREMLGEKAYYFHAKDEFLDMIYKSKKQGLVEQISKYDDWIDKIKKVYDQVVS